MSERVGIYGGTFSPPHRGHVRAAELFLRELSLDRLLVIPSHLPPHKQLTHAASAEQRLCMARLAFGHLRATEVSDLEVARGGISYTADTLRALSAEGRELFLLVGTDMFVTLDTWREPEVILRLATLCLIRREQDADMTRLIEQKRRLYEAHYGAHISILNVPPLVLSSSEVRAGEGGEDAVPAEVRAYMEREGLYREHHTGYAR